MTPLKRRSFLKSVAAGLPVIGSGGPGGANPAPGRKTDGVPDLQKVKDMLQGKTANVWLFTGDSITHGAKHTSGYRSYPEVFQERIRWELARTRDWVINTGISSQTAGQILEDFEWRVSRFAPAAVSLMIGTNDCARPGVTPDTFRNDLRRFVDKVRDLRAVPVLHTPNPIVIRLSPERKTLPEFIPVIREVAGEKDVILVDNYLFWEETHRKYVRDVYRQWLNDRLHPNYKGHQQIARLMFRELGIFDSNHPTCGGEYYEGEH